MQVPAFANNGVVVKDDGFNVRVIPKCPKCGYVEQNVTLGGNVGNGQSNIGASHCFNCGEVFNIILYRKTY